MAVSTAKRRAKTAGETTPKPDKTDSHGPSTSRLQELRSPKNGEVQHPIFWLMSDRYCKQVELALVQSTG